MTRWMLNYALDRHIADPRRFKVGPASTSLVGFLYFRVLRGIKS